MILFDQRKISASDVKTRIHFRRKSSEIYKKEHALGDSTEPHESAASMQITL